MEQRSIWRLLIALGSTHAVADAISGFSAASLLQYVSFERTILIVLLYNIVGFGLQPFFGWLVDRSGKRQQATVLGFALMALGFIVLPQSLGAAFACLAIGSGLFHVGAGALASLLTPTKTIGASVFTAPGVVGLAFGTVAGLRSLPITPFLFLAAILCLVSLATSPFILQGEQAPSAKDSSLVKKWLVYLALVLILGTAARSFVWTSLGATHFEWSAILALGLAAGLGKLLGGIAADRVGRVPVTIISLTVAGIACLLGSWPLLIVGVALLQASTPIVLATLVQRFPKNASLVAGCVLGLGIIGGGALYGLVASTPYPPQTWVFLSSLLALVLLGGGMYGFRKDQANR